MLLKLFSCFMCLLALSANAEPLRFATYASERPSEEFKKMEPIHQLLEQMLRIQGVLTPINMRIFPTYEDAVEAVVSGDTDIARLGPANYIIAKKQNPGIQLLAMESSQGKKFFNGVILVAANSPILTLSDLKGKRFAFGEANSTSGRYLAQEALMQAGITGRDLTEYDFVGRHDKVAFAVAAGSYDAGASNESTFNKYSKEKGLRKLATFPSPTHAWVARAGLDPAIVEKLQKSLLELKSPALGYLGRDGFLPSKDSDYDSLRSSMRRVQTFGD